MAEEMVLFTRENTICSDYIDVIARQYNDRVEIDFRSLGDPINPLLPPDDSSDNSLDNKRYLGLKLLHEMSDKLDYEYVIGMNCTHAEIALPGN